MSLNVATIFESRVQADNRDFYRLLQEALREGREKRSA